MDLIFLTDTIIPSRRAGAIHVEKLTNAFAGLYDQVTLISQANGRDGSGLDSKQISHESVQVPKIKGGLLLVLWRFNSVLKRKKKGVIYSRFSLVSLIASKRPYVIELHDDAWNKGRLYALAMNRAIKAPNCLGFVCITESLKKAFEAGFTFDKKVVVIEDAAQSPVATYQPEWPEKARLKIAYIGSFHRGKGLELVIPLANLMPEHDFVIIGGNEAEVSRAQALVKHENIDFKGYIKHELIEAQMGAIDICLLPNQPKINTGKRSDIGRFTSPLKMFEYMAFSKPIVASDLSVLKEVLTDQFCLFAPHDDPEVWKEKIELLTNTDLREEMGRKGHSLFVENYTWKKRGERIKKFLTEQMA